MDIKSTLLGRKLRPGQLIDLTFRCYGEGAWRYIGSYFLFAGIVVLLWIILYWFAGINPKSYIALLREMMLMDSVMSTDEMMHFMLRFYGMFFGFMLPIYGATLVLYLALPWINMLHVSITNDIINGAEKRSIFSFFKLKKCLWGCLQHPSLQ